MESHDLTELLNKTGYPLQMGLASHINATTSRHGWKVLYKEHSWKNENEKNERAGFIDLIIEHNQQVSVFVIECKRLLGRTWCFLTDHLESRREAKLWKTDLQSQSDRYCYWQEQPHNPSTPQAMFCAVQGQDTGSRMSVDNIANELISSTEAFANEEYGMVSSRPVKLRIYGSMIVTTANLKLGIIDANRVSLEDGTVAHPEYQNVPYIRFRKQLSFFDTLQSIRNLSYTPGRDQSYPIDKRKERTVFVVNANHLTEFLREWSS